MNCTKHPEIPAAGTCTYCGKFFCADCLVEVKGRMYCKDDLSKVMDDVKENAKNQNGGLGNIVINNSSSSSAAAAASATAGGAGVLFNAKQRKMHWIYFLIVGWWLGGGIAMCIVPLLFPLGRRITAAAFGYW